MSVSGTIGGTTESAGYTYDNVGRLVTSNQTSNGSSAQRRFDYDRWGNRSGVWDATSGGNQIQSVTLEQSGGAPTNRIQTVYPPKINFALSANGSSASSSSNFSSAYVPSAVINGDRKGTGWGSAGGGWMDGTSNSYPDWIQVTFNGSKTIDEIDVFTLQDNYGNPSEPTESMTFSQYGIVDFQIQYWNGLSWQTVSGGSITGNNKVWKKVNFSQITTSKIRVNITSALNNYSRVTELEAWGPGPGTNYTYDSAGNVTNDGVHTYQYDSENRIVSVDSGSTASYAYDHQNRRYKTTVGSTVTHYIWEDSQVLAEHNGSTGAVLVDYIIGSGRIYAKVASGTTSYFLSDRLSVRLTLNTSGAVVGRQAHLPFGEDFAESGTQQKHHFTSYERDGEIGTDYAVNRHHTPNVGRFISVDPYNGSVDEEDPQSWHRYSYVLNDPVNATDPAGLCTIGFHASELLHPFQWGRYPRTVYGGRVGPFEDGHYWGNAFELVIEWLTDPPPTTRWIASIWFNQTEATSWRKPSGETFPVVNNDPSYSFITADVGDPHYYGPNARTLFVLLTPKYKHKYWNEKGKKLLKVDRGAVKFYYVIQGRDSSGVFVLCSSWIKLTLNIGPTGYYWTVNQAASG